jgi:hypothetical protein
MILHVLTTMVAGWLQRHQQEVITYLLAENSVLTANSAAGSASPIPSAGSLLRWLTRSATSASRRSRGCVANFER